MNTPSQIIIYCDGCCLGNPGNGGWAGFLQFNGHEKTISGFEANTTNNRMELRAAIESLRAITKNHPIIIYTDSQYVINGITKWMPNWQKNNFKGADKKPIKNQDLWQELYILSQKFTIKWQWVRGHSGNPGNELVDGLAKQAALAK